MFVDDEPPPTATRIVVARFRATTRIALLSALAERVFFRHRGPALQLRPPVVSRLSGFRSGGHGRSHQLVEHAVQVSRRDLGVGVLARRGPHLRGDDSAPIRVLEVAVGKLVPRLAVLGVLIVHTQIPPPVLTESISWMNSFSCWADGWCSLQSSLTSRTTRRSPISFFANSKDRPLSLTAILFPHILCGCAGDDSPPTP